MSNNKIFKIIKISKNFIFKNLGLLIYIYEKDEDVNM